MPAGPKTGRIRPMRARSNAPWSGACRADTRRRRRRPEPRPAGWSVAAPRRLIKVALGLALVGSLGWGPLRAMLATTSVEALVNARVETIRSPIEGVVASAPDVGRDWNASVPAPRLRIVDPLADHARLEDLRRQYQALESQSHLLARQTELASAAQQTLEAQIERFREGRLKLLDARMAAQTAERGTAAAKASQAAAAKRRTDELRSSGVSTARKAIARISSGWRPAPRRRPLRGVWKKPESNATRLRKASLSATATTTARVRSNGRRSCG